MNTTEYAVMAERERTYWWHIGRLKIIQGYIQRVRQSKTHFKILNIGCGTGGTTDMLESFGETDNVDTSDEAIKFMKKHGYKRITKTAGIKLPFADTTYDMVGAFDVLEHIDKQVSALEEWKRVLKDDGAILVTVPAYQWLWSDHDVSLHHQRRYTAKRLAEAAKHAGLRVEKISYAIVFSLPLVVGFRFAGKMLGRAADARTSYVSLPNWLNELFTRLLYAEAKLHQFISMPAGTSVIAVLRKADLMNKKASVQPDLTVVIPAYKEQKRIGKTLDELAAYLKKNKTFRMMAIEVLVVAADAGDKTQAIVRAKQKKFTDLKLLEPGPKAGKGRDVQYGMLRAAGKAVVFMDADLATPLHYLPRFYEAHQNGADIVIAMRNLLKHHPNPLRRLVSNTGNFLFRIAGGVWVEDSQCGFKLFSGEAAQLCFSKLTIMGWGFDMEILAIAQTNKLKIKKYRVNDWVSVPGGTFDEGMLKNSLVSLVELAYILWNRIRHMYIG